MKLVSGLYDVGGMGKVKARRIRIARVDQMITVHTDSERLIGTFDARDFTALTYAQFFEEHPDFPQWANEFYGERVTNSTISELYDELSKFA